MIEPPDDNSKFNNARGPLETELMELKSAHPKGDFARRTFMEWVKSDKKNWGSLPLWFRKEARPYLGGKFAPKPKPQGQAAKDIMEAIKHYAKKEQN